MGITDIHGWTVRQSGASLLAIIMALAFTLPSSQLDAASPFNQILVNIEFDFDINTLSIVDPPSVLDYQKRRLLPVIYKALQKRLAEQDLRAHITANEMSAPSQYTLVVYVEGTFNESWLRSGDFVFIGTVEFVSPGWISKIDKREFKEYGDNFDVLIPRLQKEVGKLKLRP